MFRRNRRKNPLLSPLTPRLDRVFEGARGKEKGLLTPAPKRSLEPQSKGRRKKRERT
jgi:hypothetical protein